MIGGLYVISVIKEPGFPSIMKRTPAVDGVVAIGLVARARQRGIQSMIVSATAPYQTLPVIANWDTYAAEWFTQPAPLAPAVLQPCKH